MTARVHIARFGNAGGAHTLRGHSGLPSEVLDAIQWYTDLPSGPTVSWQPFHAGFPIARHYVVRYTRPDITADRAGMVHTTAVIADSSAYQHGIGSLLDLAASEPPLETVKLPRHEAALAPERPPELGGVIDALADEGQALWVGDEGFGNIIVTLWDVLAPEDRCRLFFGVAWHPDSIPYPVDTAEEPLLLLTAPAELQQRFDSWPVIDNAQPTRPGRVAAAVLRRESSLTAELARKLGIEQPTLRQWVRLVDAAELTSKLDSLTHDELRGAVHVLGALAPNPSDGADLKDSVTARMADVTPAGEFRHIRGLKTLPIAAFPNPPNTRDLLLAWALRVTGDSTASSDLVTAIDAARGSGGGDPWSLMEEVFRDLAASDPGPVTDSLSRLAEGNHDGQFEWLADLIPAVHDVDEQLSTLFGAHPVPRWLPEVAARRGWAITHASVCDIGDPTDAWKRQIRFEARSSVGDNVLASRTGATGTVTAALALSDSMLTALAGRLVADAPDLIQPHDITDENWRSIWLAAIEDGADPWSMIPAAEAVPQIINMLIDGQSVPEYLVRLSAVSDYADLSNHPRRAEAWSHLPRGQRDRFLNRTAQAVTRSKTCDRESLESELVTAILAPTNLDAVARVDAERAVGALEAFAGRVKSPQIMAVIDSVTLPEDLAARVGRLVYARKLKTVARRLAAKSESRDDLRAAARECVALLNLFDRIRLFFLGGGPEPTSNELHQGLYALAVKLYPAGPMDRRLWDRAGGDPADAPDTVTGRDRWRLALDAVEMGTRGAPELANLIDCMLEDFDRNDLRQIRELV